jgi:hypothetical protein
VFFSGPGAVVTPEEAVRAFFAAYSEGNPERLEDLVSPESLTTVTRRLATGRRGSATITSMPSGSWAEYWHTTSTPWSTAMTRSLWPGPAIYPMGPTIAASASTRS